MMRKHLTRMVLLMAAVAMTGCVSQGQADRYRTLYRKSQEQLVDMRAQLEEANSRIAALEGASNKSPQQQQQLAQLRQERDRLQQALSQAEQQLQSASSGPGDIPQQVEDALAELARNNPEMTYKPEQGMVKFQTDFTFPSGSAEVSENVTGTIRDLASVLDSRAAQPYGVRIVGHTDNVPIRKPSTKQKHPTNWHLSVHRAIAIEKVLEDAGITPDRMSVAGFGSYRPIVPNGPDGAKKNRRVELYLVKRSETSGAPGPGPAPGPGMSQGPAGQGPAGESGSGSPQPRSKSGPPAGSGSESGSQSQQNPVRYK